MLSALIHLILTFLGTPPDPCPGEPHPETCPQNPNGPTMDPSG